MKILIDTNVLIWWLQDSPRLGPRCRASLADRGNTVHVSVVSVWEMAIKVRIGKLKADVAKVLDNIESDGFSSLPISGRHLDVFATLPLLHRDPFDTMLVAQAVAEGAVLYSSDAALKAYPVDFEQV